MIDNVSKDFIWHAINIHSKFSYRYHYTVEKFLVVAETLFGDNIYGLTV